jgi:hypothetical protein
MISRMYVGAHSLDQIVFGGLLGLAFLIYYKFFLQELLYQMVTNILNNRHKRFYFVVTTIIAIIFITLPVVIYLITTQQGPVNQVYLDNILLGCGKTLSSEFLYAKSLSGTALSFIGIGIMYGLLLLTNKHNQDVLYFTGNWNYRDRSSALFLLLALIIVAGIPAIILILIIPILVQAPIVIYFCICIGIGWASFALIYLLAHIHNKYRWISYLPPATNT